MADVPAELDELVGRLIKAMGEPDLFRVIVRGFGVFDDILEREIAKILPEPLDGLDGSPFRHKLNLAAGLGLIHPTLRAPIARLAKIRHDLAHADRGPEEVTLAELEEIRGQLDPTRSTDALLHDGQVPLTIPLSAGLTVLAASMRVMGAGHIARELRDNERKALQRELEAGGRVSPIIAALMRSQEGDTGAQSGAQDA